MRLIPEHLTRHSATSAFLIYRKTQYVVVAVSLLVGAIVFFEADLVATRIFNKPQLSAAIAISAVFVTFKALMDLNTQALRGLSNIRIYAIIQTIPPAAMLVALVAVTLLCPHPESPLYAQLSAYALGAIVGLAIVGRIFSSRMRPEDDITQLTVSEILEISLPMLMTASMSFFVGQVGVLMLGALGTESDVGYYSIAIKLSTLTAFVLFAVNSMAAPKYSELFHLGNLDDLFHVAKKSTKLIFWATVPILIVLLCLGKQVLSFLFGHDFTAAYPAMAILVIGQFVNAISGSTGLFMNMTGHQNALSVIISAAAITNFYLNWILIPRFGMNGAAAAATVSLALWNVSVLVYIKCKYGRTIGYFPAAKWLAERLNSVRTRRWP